MRQRSKAKEGKSAICFHVTWSDMRCTILEGRRSSFFQARSTSVMQVLEEHGIANELEFLAPNEMESMIRHATLKEAST